jgi:Ca2+-binding RTX toxin-like protein
LLAEDFTLSNSAQVMGLRWWGGGSNATQFDVYLYSNSSNGNKNLPDYKTQQHLGKLTATRTDTGQNNDWGQRVYRYDVTLATPLDLTAGTTYWLSIVAPDYAWQWQDAGDPGHWPASDGVNYAVAASGLKANNWNSSWDNVKHNLAFEVLQAQGLEVKATNGNTFIATSFQDLEVSGGGGDDTVIIGNLSGIVTEPVMVDLGAGDDVLDGSGAMMPIIAYGGSGDDTLKGGSGADTLEGGPGEDTVLGNAGDDTIIWRDGDGSDAKVDGGTGLNTLQLFGSEGDDTIDVSAGLPAAGWSQSITGNPVNGWQSVSNPCRLLAEDFTLSNSAQVMGLRWWGGGSNATQFDVYLYNNGNGNKNLPDYKTQQHLGRLTATRTDTGQNNDWGQRVYRYDVTLPIPLNLTAGVTYWLSIVAPDYAWQWQDAGDPGHRPALDGVNYAVAASGPKANDWNSSWDDVKHNLAFEVLQAQGLKVDANGSTFIATNLQDLEVWAGRGDDTVIIGNLSGIVTEPVMVDLGAGDDVLDGSSATTPIIAYGRSGNDVLTGGSAADWLKGGDGNDVLEGGNGNDVLIGGRGDDTLDGGFGDDRLFGGQGDDKLLGGDGNDVLKGGGGNDTLDGGPGKDSLIDWAGKYEKGKGNGTSAWEETGVSASASWVEQFVSNLASTNGTLNPNSSIQVVIPGREDNQTSPARERRR